MIIFSNLFRVPSPVKCNNPIAALDIKGELDVPEATEYIYERSRHHMHQSAL